MNKLFVALILTLGLAQSPLEGQDLRGSKEVARAQNRRADKEKLTRIANEEQLRRFVELERLVPLPNNLFVRIDPRLAGIYRYCRPWTRDFLNDLGRAHTLTFGRPIQVNSAVRPITRQKELQKTNGNAAPVTGPTRSSHPTASTVDIAKGNNVEWMRDYLRAKKATGQIILAEEFNQEVFHIFVSNIYGKKVLKAPVAKGKKPSKAKPPAKPKPKPPPRKRK